MSNEFDPYYAWLGIPPKDQPPNHYRLLGIELFEANLDVIESAAFRQMGHVRTFQTGKHSAESQRLLNELSAAKICLLNAEQKETYDQGLQSSVPIVPLMPDDGIDESQLPTPMVEAVVQPTFEPAPAPVVAEVASQPAATAPAPAAVVRRRPTRRMSQRSITFALVGLFGFFGVMVCFGFVMMASGIWKRKTPPVVVVPPTTPGTTPPGQPTPGSPNNPGGTRPTPGDVTPRPSPLFDPRPSGTGNSGSSGPNPALRVSPVSEVSVSDASPANHPRMRLKYPLPGLAKTAIVEADGIVTEQFAIAQTMPYLDLVRIKASLRDYGYRPIRLRPFAVRGETRIASVWTRDAVNWRIVMGVDANEVKKADQTFQQSGFKPIDVCAWQANGTKFAAIWVANSDPADQRELTLDVTRDDFTAVKTNARQRGLIPGSHHTYHDTVNVVRYSNVWYKPEKLVTWRDWNVERDAHERWLKISGPARDVSLEYTTNGTLMYSGLAVDLPDTEVVSLNNFDAAQHRTECEKLVANGYRPIGLSAAQRPTSTRVWGASIWQRDKTNANSPATAAVVTTQASDATAKATHVLRFNGTKRVAISNTRNLATRGNEFTAELWFRGTDPTLQSKHTLMGNATWLSPSAVTTPGTAAGWHVTIGQRSRGSSQLHGLTLRLADMRGNLYGMETSIRGLVDQWHHLAICHVPRGSLTQTEVFLDGRRVQGTARPARDAVISQGDFFLGSVGNLEQLTAFPGEIKAFRLSSKVRYRGTFTPEETFSSDSSTLVLLDFDGQNRGQIRDISGNNRHGLISNAAWHSVGPPAGTVVANEPPKGAPPQLQPTINPPANPANPPEPPAAQPVERLAVPPQADRLAGSVRVKDIFVDELAEADDKDKRLNLANDFLNRGLAEKDPVAKFALLYEVRELSIAACDLQTTLNMTDQLSKCFKFDPWILKCDAVTKLAVRAKADVDRKEVANAALGLADVAIEKSDWKNARSLVASASKLNARLKDRDVLRSLSQKRTLLDASEKLWGDAEEAKMTLAITPDDAAANWKLGRYYCFVKDEWKDGLQHLAKGSDEVLAKLAVQDAENPTGVEALALADGWYEWSEKAEKQAKNGAMQRARHWYTLALRDVTGLDRTVAEKKLDELNSKVDGVAPSRKLSWLEGAVGELKQLEGHTTEVTTLDVSRNGAKLVSGSSDGTVRIWDLALGKETGLIRPNVSRISRVAFIRDDQFLLVIGSRTTAEIWNARTGKPATSMKIPSALRDTALSEDDKILACGRTTSSSGNVSIYNLGTGAIAGQLNCPSYPHSVAVSATGRLVAAGSNDENVYVWNLSTRQPAGPFVGLTRDPTEVAIAPNEQLVAACSTSEVIIWDLANGKVQTKIPFSGSSATQLVFSPDSRRLLLAGAMHQLSVFNVQNGQLIQQLTGQVRSGTSVARALAYLPDPRGAVTAGYDGIIRIWRLPD